jgi:D-arabinose 1-dehydrogenase-like Zn-dependent alcohol dehydrogenase
VPHAKYLYPYGNLPEELACLYACSGITAFGAVKKAAGHDGGKPILVIGAGGVGLMGVRFAKAVLGREPIVADIDENKRKLALANGACAAIDPREKEARKQVMDLTGGSGVAAAIDFVGNEASAQFGWRALGRGGRLVIVGLFGGAFSTPLPMFPFTGNAIMGSVTGTPAEMKEMMDIVTAGKAEPVPVIKRGLDEANATLTELSKGLIMGRAVLIP